jgi:hypothetical protein
MTAATEKKLITPTSTEEKPAGTEPVVPQKTQPDTGTNVKYLPLQKMTEIATNTYKNIREALKPLLEAIAVTGSILGSMAGIFKGVNETEERRKNKPSSNPLEAITKYCEKFLTGVLPQKTAQHA